MLIAATAFARAVSAQTSSGAPQLMLGSGIVIPLGSIEVLPRPPAPFPFGGYVHFAGTRRLVPVGVDIRSHLRLQHIAASETYLSSFAVGVGLSLPIAPESRFRPYWFLVPQVHVSWYDGCLDQPPGSEPDYTCSGARVRGGLVAGGGVFLGELSESLQLILEAELTHLAGATTALSIGMNVGWRAKPRSPPPRCCRTEIRN